MNDFFGKGNKMNRGKFLGFLGKIGLFSLLGVPALAQTKIKIDEKVVNPAPRKGPILIRKELKPSIKGHILSQEALTAKLATDNLENIRDLMTGRFFGKAAKQVFKDGYQPFINWKLNSEDGDTGCFFYADTNPGAPPIIDNCGMYLTWTEKSGRTVIDIASTGGPSPIDPLGGDLCRAKQVCWEDCQEDCAEDCSDQCNEQCSGTYCSGTYCNPKNSFEIYEILENPTDRFASEIMNILGTSDVGIVQRELRNAIFSDETLNLGLEHFVNAAYKAKALDSAGTGE